jgi:ribosome maturation factor RimP
LAAVANVDAQVETLRQRLAPAVGALDLELYDVELTGAGKARTLRVTVDRSGGVDLEAITAATHAISAIVDDGPAPSGPFLLEVTSPGVERQLRTPAHYAGAVGTAVSIKVRTHSGSQRLHGTLIEAGAEHCEVDLGDRREVVDYADVTHARTVFEWGPQPRPGQRRSAGAATGKGVTA